MRSMYYWAIVCSALLLISCGFVFGSQTPATERVLYNFTGGSDGSEPTSGVTLDRAGNLYGVTFFGGSAGQGAVYEISRTSNGIKQSILYSFKGGTQDGANPSGTLILSSNGVIFGTTEGGGKGNGVVYKLTPSGSTFQETILHVFGTGETPINAGVITDKAGNLFGETAGGGKFNDGTVYELKRTAAGYRYVVLYSFASGNDGDFPSGGLISDSAGNLYGTTASGGPSFIGDVFELKKNTNGTFTESILYTFQSTADGVNPESALAFDASGNLFGTTLSGGDTSCGQGFGCGEVFELTNTGGVWTKTAIHEFTDNPDGHAPQAGVTFDSAGNMFGTTMNGGSSGLGVLYELSPGVSSWTETILHAFTNGTDGGFPTTPVTIDGKGNLFGTTQFGGTSGDGVVFAFPRVAAP
ncbi:MAG: choice-of-anchor tandem repeat GloVer-containing protein [Candidatus Sulfotelmatobacter sp.]